MCSRTRATARAPSLETVFQSGSSFGPSASCQTRAFTRQTCESSILPRPDPGRSERAACPARGRSPPRSASPRSARMRFARSRGDAERRDPLRGGFAAIRVRVGDGPRVKDGVHLPGDEAWLIAERRTDEIRYYLSNRARSTSLKALAASVKARWSCEQAHQQLKEELGLDHFEGRPGTVCTITPCSRWWPSPFSTSETPRK